jgi:hypothetical protein
MRGATGSTKAVKCRSGDGLRGCYPTRLRYMAVERLQPCAGLCSETPIEAWRFRGYHSTSQRVRERHTQRGPCMAVGECFAVYSMTS